MMPMAARLTSRWFLLVSKSISLSLKILQKVIMQIKGQTGSVSYNLLILQQLSGMVTASFDNEKGRSFTQLQWKQVS